MRDRLDSELSSTPTTGFVEFVDGGGLKIGASVIGEPSILFQGGTNTLVFDADEHNGIGVVDGVVTASAFVGGGDLYDDAYVYSCFEVQVDLEAKTLVGIEDVACPVIVTSGLAPADKHVSFDDLQ